MTSAVRSPKEGLLSWELGGVLSAQPLTAEQEDIRVNHRAAFHSVADELVAQRRLGALSFGYPYAGPYPPSVEEYSEQYGLDNVLEAVIVSDTKSDTVRVGGTGRILWHNGRGVNQVYRSPISRLSYRSSCKFYT